MLIQRILAWIDRRVTEMFSLEAWGSTSGSNGESTWLYYVRFGEYFGVVGVDGKIHTVMRSRAVLHCYRAGRLTKRILARKDLKEGERLATQGEIKKHMEELRRMFNEGGGLSLS